MLTLDILVQRVIVDARQMMRLYPLLQLGKGTGGVVSIQEFIPDSFVSNRIYFGRPVAASFITEQSL